MTHKKCPLCSKLSSKLKQLIHRFLGGKIDCQGINHHARNEKRVSEINSLAPDCKCEQYRMSKYSPNIVVDTEKLSRFVFSPYQVDRKGKLKPSAFSHVYNKGCSIQRDSLADNEEIFLFVNRFLGNRDDYIWRGVLVADCSVVRNIFIKSQMKRAVCVYDTGTKDNPSHGEICQTHHVLDEDDKIELRHDLLMAFGNKRIISPDQYRSSSIWDNLHPQFQN